MISQVRTATLSQSILPKPEVKTYVALILVLGILAALFEAISPTSFSLVSPLSWQSVLKDAAKNLGIVVSFGLGLAYIAHIAKRAITARSVEAQPIPDAGASPWTVLLGDAVRIIAFSFLITLFARISIHFGDNPVPITGQTLAVLFTGAALGSRLGLLATVMYLCQGAAGMHVFAGGGFGSLLAAGQRWVHHWVRRCCISGWRPGGTRLGQRRSTSRGHAHRQRYVVHTGIDTTGCLRRVGKYLELGSVPVHTGRPCQTLCCLPDGPSGLGFSPVP